MNGTTDDGIGENGRSPLPVQDIRSFLTWKVAAGYEDDKELVRRAIEAFQDEGTEAELLDLIVPLVADLVAEHQRAEADWPEVTDCDRLDRAFAELERQGILARQDYWCCSTCGHAAALEEMEEEARAGRPAQGYVFFHNQDTEYAICGDVYLAYGAVQDTEEAVAGVARTVIEVLGHHNLTAVWGGNTNERILVRGLDWKRRRRFPRAAGARGRDPNPPDTPSASSSEP